MESATRASASAAIADAVVMIVEDDESTRGALACLFSSLGARVLACPDAEEGCVTLQHELPDAVICDIFLPGMDGYYFVQKLRERELQLSAAPSIAIALTGDDGEVPRLRSIGEGFQHFMAKPPDIDALVSFIAQGLHSRGPAQLPPLRPGRRAFGHEQ